MERISRDEAISLLKAGKMISIDIGVDTFTIDDYIETDTGNIIWITFIGSKLIRDYLVKEYYK